MAYSALVARSNKSKVIDSLKLHWPLLIILGSALVIRLTAYIGAVRGDDFRYLAAAYYMQFGEINTNICCGLDRVGIYWPINLIFRVLGINEISSVLFPLLASLSTIAIIYSIVYLLHSKEAALIAAFLWAIFPLDILMATQILPDSIALGISTGAVLATIMAFRAVGVKRYTLFAIIGLLFVWNIYVKEITLLNYVFCFLFAAWFYLNKKIKQFWNKPIEIFGKRQYGKLFLGLAVIGFVVFLINFTDFGDTSFLSALARNANDMAEALLLGLPSPYFITPLPRVTIMDLFLPLVLITSFVLVSEKNKSVLFPLAWFIVVFGILEWGPDANFSNYKFIFKPPYPRLLYDRRHLLFVFVPTVIILAIYLTNFFKEKRARTHITSLAIIATGLWIIAQSYIENQQLINLLSAISIFTVGAFFVSVYFYQYTQDKRGQVIGLVLLLLVSVSFIYPSDRYHSSNWQDDRQLLERYRSAANYLDLRKEKYPIVTYPQNSLRLNYASGFSLGYNWKGSLVSFPQARIQDINLSIPTDVDLFVVYAIQNGGISNIQGEIINENWIKLVDFGFYEDAWMVSIYHVLPNKQ